MQSIKENKYKIKFKTADINCDIENPDIIQR